MTENEAKTVLNRDLQIQIKNKALPDGIEATQIAINALEDIQKYRLIERELKENYHANVDIPLLMQHFIETIFKGEKHDGFCILTNEDAAQWDQYRAIGTPEECRKSVEICKAMIERGIEPENVEAYIAFEDACVKKGFTIKGLLEAGEKQTIKDPIRLGKCTCPSCGTYNETWKKRRNTVASDIVYCWHCGQAVEIFREDNNV